MGAPILTIANQLTILRMALAPFLVVALVSARFGWAVTIFALAAVTDLLDGLMARRVGQKTALGATLDPLADKMLLGSAFVALTWNSAVLVKIPVWVTILTLSRDLMIVAAVLIINMTVERRVFFPSLLGKISTAAQVVTVALVLILNWLGRGPAWLEYVFAGTVLLTLASGGHYVYLASTRKGTPIEVRK